MQRTTSERLTMTIITYDYKYLLAWHRTEHGRAGNHRSNTLANRLYAKLLQTVRLDAQHRRGVRKPCAECI